jgi:hypothetical protein
MPSTADKNLILQSTHDISVKLELLTDGYIVLDEIRGRVVSMPINISATSDIRRTCNLVLGVIDGSFSAENFEIDWLNRLIKASIGLWDGSDYEWYLIGHFLLDAHSYAYDATTNELTLSLLDMMAGLTDSRGSQIGRQLLIPYESNVRTAMIAIVARFSPFVRYNVAEFPDVIPYDLEFPVGAYAHTILKQIIDLFPYYQMYYSPTGYFTVAQIPTSIGDPLFVDKTFMDAIIIKETRSGKLGNIKNTTEIWGAELDATYAAIDTNTVGDTYVLTHTTPLLVLESGADYMFAPDTDSIVGQKIQVDALAAVPLYNSDGTALTAGALVADRAYVIRYSPTIVGETVTPRFLLQGEWQIHVIVKEVNVMPDATYIATDKIFNDCNDIQYVVNPDSPFACDRGSIDYNDGEIRQVLSDGDYSQIYTTELAYQRAAYETWLKTRFQTDTEITCLLAPWMDVNVKIEYTSPVTGIARQYIVKEVAMNPADFTMTLKLSRFYPYYPFL